MKKRKLKYLLLSGLLVSAISGCGKLEEEREKKLEEEATNLDTIHDTSETNEKKVFDTGKHVFFRREYSYEDHASIIVPEEYEVLDIESSIDKDGMGSETDGYIVWYRNLVPVEVEAVYDSSKEEYDYSNFGTAIEKEKVLEK